MDDFARRPAEDRRAYIEEAASRRDLTPIIIEKDFWVCWTLRRLTTTDDLQNHVTFKGGTSLSKAYGIIERFSEDVDLTIRGAAPMIDTIPSPMAEGIGTKERERRTKALKTAAQHYVADIAMPSLARAIELTLGSREGWSIEPDPDDKNQQTLLFNYPRTLGNEDGVGYIKPRIKLEYGARGEPEPFEQRSIVPYLAEEFPDELPDAETSVETLSVTRTFWEKATILHALHHNGKLREGMSRHYYDLLMLDRAGITDEAITRADLLVSVVRNKSLMFADKSASYDSAVFGQLRLSPDETIVDRLRNDYIAMADMFMSTPPAFDDLLVGIAALETKLNGIEQAEPAPPA